MPNATAEPSPMAALGTDRPRRRRPGLVLGLLAASGLIAAGIAAWTATQSRRIPVFDAEIVKRYPHDPAAFTQGLEFSGDDLFEGTGQYGESTLRKVELETGEVLQETALPSDVFGEGITVWKDQIVQLTWESRLALIFDKATFEPAGRFRYNGEGWGLTHDATHLIMSDGTPELRFLDPETHETVKTLRVTVDGRPLSDINELEYINGEILANVWNTQYIARISAEDGRVVGWIDLSNVRPRRANGTNAVLNGIAFEPKSRRLFVTGKNWSELFEIRLKRR